MGEIVFFDTNSHVIICQIFKKIIYIYMLYLTVNFCVTICIWFMRIKKLIHSSICQICAFINIFYDFLDGLLKITKVIKNKHTF